MNSVFIEYLIKFVKISNRRFMQPNYKDRILKILSTSPSSMKIYDFAKFLKVKSETDSYDTLRNNLNELLADGKIFKHSKRRYSLNSVEESVIEKSFVVQGQIKIEEQRGTILDPKTRIKYIIKHRNLNTALDADIVEIKPLAEKIGKKPQAFVNKIIKRSEKLITGKLENDGYFSFLVPDEPKYYVDFLIPPKKLNGAKPGDKVTCKFLCWEDPLKSPEAEIIKILGSSGINKVEYSCILDEFSLPSEFSKKLNQEAEKIEISLDTDTIKQRIDLRAEEIITIDPDDAKDFDDALSLKILENGNYYLGVHIADVSHFIKHGSVIDNEASKRGNSTYLVDQVVPMLPEKLSNDICSLKPNRVRLTFSVFMEFTEDCVLKDYKIAESIIKSKKRFTYDEVLKVIEGKSGPHQDLVLKLHELATKLKAIRLKSGGINFETVEIKFKLDENQDPLGATQKKTTKSTSLVEECMLVANKTVAEHVLKLTKIYKLKEKLPFLYRIHSVPNPDKLNSVLEFIMMLGHKGDARSGTAKAINELLAQFEDRQEKPIVNQMLVRAMPKAEYHPDNIGHYGLGFKNYSHFTSPIRRYPDLVVHRLLKEYAEQKPIANRIEYLNSYLEEIGEQTTTTERNSMEAERASVKLAQIALAKKYVGEIFDGTISGVTSFGIFVILDNIYAEGMLHIRDLLDDYYIFDEKYFRLIGRRTNKIYRFGDRIKVKIIRVNFEKRKIELKLIDK